MSVYDYTTPQIIAMWKAYAAAPDDTTVAELRELMDTAAAAAADNQPQEDKW